jgi:hypothetical protein
MTTLPPTRYVERVPNLAINLNKLVQEYQSVEHLMADVTPTRQNDTLVQRKFHLKLHGIDAPEIFNLQYTLEIAKNILALQDFDAITYRLVMPNTCYNWHVDAGRFCVHIPLITNLGCRFVYETRAFSMPADGSIYVVNNGVPHTFVNAGPEPRLHLTFENL